MKKTIAAILITATTALCGCVYQPPIEQGNILTPEKMQTIHNGMSSAEVIAQLGSPVLKNVYHENRISYVYTRQPKRNQTKVTRFIVTFQNDRVVSAQ